MKIVFINTLYHPDQFGGAEVSVQILAENMAKRGHQVSVICLNPSGKNEVITHNGVEINRIKTGNIYWPLSDKKRPAYQKLFWHTIDCFNIYTLLKIARILKSKKAEILHTNNLSGISVSAWLAARINKVKIAHTSRDYYLLHPNCKLYHNNTNQDTNSFSVKAWSFPKKILSRSVHSYIGISQYIHDIHINSGFFKKSQKHVIYNPITPPRPSQKKTSARKVFGYFGRIDRAKGLETFLLAANELPKDYSFLIAGKGEDDYLKELSNKFPDFGKYYYGFSAPSDFFSKINYLIVPSLWHEPLGRVVLESYSYGIPVITADTGGLPEIVRQGKTGLTYKSKDHSNLKIKIQEILELDYTSMQNECLKFSQAFKESTICDQYESVFKNLSSV